MLDDISFEITQTIHPSPSNNFKLEIIERTPTILKLEAKGASAFLSVIALAGSLSYIVVALGMLIYTTTLTTLKCNRLNQKKVACELISSSLVKEHITPIMTPIMVEEFQAANKKGTQYGITLLSETENIPLSGLSSSSAKINAKRIKKINNFISNSEQMSFEIQQNNRWSTYGIIGLHVLFGSGVISRFLTKKLSITCIFDKDADQMYLKQHNLFKNVEIREEIMYEIRQAQKVEKTDKKGNKAYNIKLLLKSDKEITILPLDVSYDTYKITHSINHFLQHQSRKKSN